MSFPNSPQFQTEGHGVCTTFLILLAPQTLMKMMIEGSWDGRRERRELGFVRDITVWGGCVYV